MSLRPLVEHIYVEDRRQAVLEVATTSQLLTTQKGQRTYRPAKLPEKRSSLHNSDSIPMGKKAIGTCVSVEFYNDLEEPSYGTSWYKGTVTSFN